MPRSNTYSTAGLPRDRGISNDYQVGGRFEVRRLVTFTQSYALCLKLRTHGRVHLGVRPRHPVALRTRQQRQATHEGTADTEDMNMHAR